ncbi:MULTISPECIES: sodium-dependent transporter [Bacillaceae]|uniref:sodium-dependent transporter n=1 Tax=Bacillaceae TaxID=186817 RepID=UPI001C589BD6|nr:sodium-dependent transporter [Rossellomorea sp. YZS02]MBW3111125.1 sodium-dependent transporter [Bacillus sp. MCCB 382]MDX8346205.1 sodium-dependent transporter [Rossellomorea sp. YZS02]
MAKKDQWTSKIGFILAAAGSAIGLGAIWKFPYMAGANGGGVFFLLFILFTVLIGAPILLAEFVIGRRAGADAVTSYKILAPNSKWHWIGYLGTVVSFIILSFYSVVGGWILSYLGRSVTGSLIGKTQQQYGALFESIIANPKEVLIAQFAFIVMTVLVVQGGIQKGIERASRYMMPALFILFIILVIRSLTLEGAMEGVRFLLLPDWSYLNGETVLLALGQAFFALTVGLSVMVTYASYLSKNDSMPRSAISVSGLNIFISLLAGLVIFPAVYALGFQPDEGPGIAFVVLPAVFNEIAFGGIFLTVFLVLLLFATLTSAFSILEIGVAALSKGNQKKRMPFTWLIGILVFIAGIPSALSFGVFNEFLIGGKNFFDFADYITSNFGLPIGALLISIFVSYRLKREDVWNELQSGSSISEGLFNSWIFLLRYIVPVAILLVFLS